MKRVDILVSGGGLVGLPLGLALAQGGFRVMVADAAPPAHVLAPQFDGRVSALAYASVRMLAALGVWDGLKAHAQPIREILVSDGQIGKPASPFSLHFDSSEVGANSLGHIAENRHIRAAGSPFRPGHHHGTGQSQSGLHHRLSQLPDRLGRTGLRSTGGGHAG